MAASVKEQWKREHRAKRSVSLGKIAGFMLLFAFLCSYGAFLAEPLWSSMGLSGHTMARYGLLLGVGLGAALAFVKSVTEFIVGLALQLAMWGIFSFFGVLLGGALLAVNVPPEIASWAPPACLGLGVVLSLVIAYAYLDDIAHRFRGKPESRADP